MLEGRAATGKTQPRNREKSQQADAGEVSAATTSTLPRNAWSPVGKFWQPG